MDRPSGVTRRRPRAPEPLVPPVAETAPAPAPPAPEAIAAPPPAPVLPPPPAPIPPRGTTDFEGLAAIADMDPAEARRLMDAFSGGPKQANLRRGDRVTGRITRLGSNVAFVHVGTKADATLERNELPEGAQVGDEITAFVTNNPMEGEVKLTTVPSGDVAVEMLESTRVAGGTIEGRVVKSNEHGFEVQLGQGVRGFCPLSHIDRPPITEPESYVGRSMGFRVLEVRGREAIVSHRAIADEEAEADRARQLSLLSKDDIYPGVVISLREFGAFVRLPTGVEGLVPLANLARQRVSHPSEVLKEGQEVNVRVMSIDLERKRLGLSIRHAAQPGELAPASPMPSTPTARAPEPQFGVLAGLLSGWKSGR